MNYFDIHTHIAPGIDDGAKNDEITLKMLQISYDSGVRNIILTPHYDEPQKLTADVSGCIENMRKLAGKISPDLNIYPGNEVFFTNKTKSDLLEKKAATLADSKYVLLEFSYGISSKNLVSGINQILMCGYWPIIAHLERYQCMYEKGLAKHLSDMGAYLQMNAGFIVSSSGFKTSRFISKLFKDNLISFIGSDCHNITSRPPNIGKCAEVLDKKFGSEVTERILMRNPEKIIKNERL